MENRNARRITIGFRTEILYGEYRFGGTIENLSPAGVCILSDPLDEDLDFLTGSPIQLTFHPREDETLILHCILLWAKRPVPEIPVYKIGMEISDPPWEQSRVFV